MRVFRSIDDYSDDDVSWVLKRTTEHLARTATSLVPPGFLAGLMFFETSLRTRTGFASAVLRLGGQVVEVVEPRHSEISAAESSHDTLRTLAGYTDIVVVRLNEPLTAALPSGLAVPVVSGGDRGARAEHPTQALIDIYAMESEIGPVGGLTVAILGDPRMRSVASLLRWFARHPPRCLVLVTEDALLDGFSVPPPLAGVVERRTLADVSGIDVLYVAGIPHRLAAEDVRTSLRVTGEVLDRLPTGAVAMSPLPVIDEVDAGARSHPKFHAFVHSDWALGVRMAVMELALQ